MPVDHSNEDIKYTCLKCLKECSISEETFNYPPNDFAPLGGKHYTGLYFSDCCDAEFKEK